MAYTLHIERLPLNNDGEPTPISLEEWKAAASATDNVRLSQSGAHSITNPKTKEIISFPIRDGDCEVYFADKKIWNPTFSWFGGAAHVNAQFSPGDRSNAVWSAMLSLATRLNAVIRGDDGELYDLQTGKVEK